MRTKFAASPIVAIVFGIAAASVVALWLLYQHPVCPGPVIGPQALPWLQQQHAVSAVVCVEEIR